MFLGIKHMLWERRAEALFKELFERFPLPLAGRVLYSHTPQRGQKAYTFFDDDGSYRVVIDLEEHHSQEDVENSCYHEFRHLMQHEMLEEGYIRRCNRLKRDMAWYLFSPTEIDARVFARSRGEIADRRVFEDIGRLDDFASSKMFLYKCMEVSRKYGVG